MHKITKVLRFSDRKRSCWTRLTLTNGEPVWVSIAQTGILVKRSRLGLLGATLYSEKRIYHAAGVAKELSGLCPAHPTLPHEIENIVLRAFVNAILHCDSATQVAACLNEAQRNE
jgi:hypothetical protein